MQNYFQDLLQQHLNIQIRAINVSVKNGLNDQGQFTQGFLLEPSHPQNPGGLSKKVFLETALTPAFEENLIYTSKGF